VEKLKILNFTPYAFIDVHAVPEALTVDALRSRGHSVLQMRCKGVYGDYCIAMSAAGLIWSSSIKEKKAVCDVCRKRSLMLAEKFRLDFVWVEDFIDEGVVRECRDLVGRINEKNWADFVVDEVPIGRYASYEFVLNNKLSTLDFNERFLLEYQSQLYNALVTFYAVKKYLESNECDRVVVYNNLYSCNHIASVLCSRVGALVYSLHAGSHHRYRLSEMTVFRDYAPQALVARNEAWARYGKQALIPQSVTRAFEHVQELLTAKSPWVYTVRGGQMTADMVRSYFGVKKQKVLLAMMASGDERFGAALVDAMPEYETPIFPTQFEWIDSLISHYGSDDDFFVIIRVHPREFPNKRESVLSEQATILKKRLQSLPSNIVVNWPDDNISLHDLVKITDVGLNATSTSGLELLLFGIPVVIFDQYQLFSYPKEFNYIAESVADYWHKVDAAIADGLSVKRIVDAFRWISFKSEVVGIDISDGYFLSSSFLSKLVRRLRRYFGRDFLAHLKWSFGSTLINSKWLVYAIESGVESHMDDFVRFNEIRSDDGVELQSVVSCARRYFGVVGCDFSRFERSVMK